MGHGSPSSPVCGTTLAAKVPSGLAPNLRRRVIQRPVSGSGGGTIFGCPVRLLPPPVPMTIRLQSLALVLVCLLLAGGGPAYAQSDVTGPVPASDVSGTLARSDRVVFQADEARIRMADLAAALTRALRAGALPTGGTGSESSVAVPAGVADLLLASSGREGRAAAQQLTDVLTAQGVPSAQAIALARTTTGLLATEQVDPEQFLATLHAFNAVVDVAPAPVLARPPQAFVVVRTVLMALLPGSIS